MIVCDATVSIAPHGKTEVHNGRKTERKHVYHEEDHDRDGNRNSIRSCLLELVGQIEERAPKIIAEYREKLEGKVKELLEDTQIDEGRIASEIVIFADKICTDEEVVRLRSHVEHMKATLQSDDSGIGRKLDFIAQEMNREANTVLSKANDLETSNIGIELKTEIEKVREQIQNIE